MAPSQCRVIAGQLSKGSNRVMVGLSLIISLVGCVLISDWQAMLHRDPCSSPSSISNETYSGDWIIASGDGRDIVDNNITDFQLNVENCESRSTSLHRCFWNPKSRVTGDYCSTCLQTCLSENISLNFYQFIIGVFLTAMGSILGFVFDSALISDVTPTKNQVYSLLNEKTKSLFILQGSVTAVLVGCNALSRAITPFWCTLKVCVCW